MITIIYLVIGNFRGTFSSVNTLKGYMFISQNAEGVHGQRKVGNPCFNTTQIYGFMMCMSSRLSFLTHKDCVENTFQ